jgi:hypothetical protein
MRDSTTRDFPSAPSLLLPLGCLTASAVHALAHGLERLAAFHRKHDGAPDDVPCVKEIFVDNNRVFARVLSGTRTFKLELIAGAWSFT